MNEDQITIGEVFAHGDGPTRLSSVLMGAGLLGHKQVAKGIIVLISEVAFLMYMALQGLRDLALFVTLGTETYYKVWNEGLQVFEYLEGDNSQRILLSGVVCLFAIAGFITLWVVQLKHSYRLQRRMEQGQDVPTLRQDMRSLLDGNFHITLMAIPCLGILIFNMVPLVYMILMAFTTYSREGGHLILFDWDGLNQFGRVLSMQGSIGRQFWQVLGWTISWAVLSTLTNFVLGMGLAMIINRKDTKAKGFWRFCFVLSIAVPQFVTLMIANIMLRPSGAVNVLLMNLGLIDSPIPFWTNTMLARFMIILINIWVGVPYTMLQVTGILQNIPPELFEAAKMDGAGPARIFRKITLPYTLFVTAPYLITSFVGNINNFNVIYLLSNGGPTKVGDTAGQTDLLVTWLYKLTIDQQYYNLGAVIGIITFVILSIITLVTYRHSSSYQNEEAFM